MTDDDLFVDKDDRMEVDPNDLGPIFHTTLMLSLAKRLADQYHKPWKKETELQDAISALVASAYGRGLKTIRIMVTRKTGQKVTRDLEVDKISKERTLQ